MHAFLAKSIAVIAAVIAISAAVRGGDPVSGASAFRLLADGADRSHAALLATTHRHVPRTA